MKTIKTITIQCICAISLYSLLACSASHTALNSNSPHSRTKATKRLTDQNILAQIAKNDSVWYVRKEAVSKLTDQNVLAQIALRDPDIRIRQSAFNKLTPTSKKKIEAEICKKLKRVDTIDRYISYLELYPNGQCITDNIKLILELRSDDEKIRIKAFNKLSKIDDKLSRSDVDKIIHMMRYDSKEFSKFLYRQSHCSWYEYSSIKYYAANILIKIKSPYINEELLNEARGVTIDKGKTRRRVTDPGWV
jgi:hypothetical protein